MWMRKWNQRARETDTHIHSERKREILSHRERERERYWVTERERGFVIWLLLWQKVGAHLSAHWFPVAFKWIIKGTSHAEWRAEMEACVCVCVYAVHAYSRVPTRTFSVQGFFLGCVHALAPLVVAYAPQGSLRGLPMEFKCDAISSAIRWHCLCCVEF